MTLTVFILATAAVYAQTPRLPVTDAEKVADAIGAVRGRISRHD
jgi:hypothetical protein